MVYYESLLAFLPLKSDFNKAEGIVVLYASLFRDGRRLIIRMETFCTKVVKLLRI